MSYQTFKQGKKDSICLFIQWNIYFRLIETSNGKKLRYTL